MKALHDAGADRFTVAIDLATEDLFDKHRGETIKGPHRWDRYWNALTEAKNIFGKGNIGAHLISGMGETEQEMAAAIQLVSDRGGTTHLFSFYPEKGSKLENKKPCEPGQYRKVQLARYLIDKDISKYEKMTFDSQGRIMDYGVTKDQEEPLIDSGKPFETCGCPGKGDRETACNRPYGDGPPSDIKSYPFPLESADIKKVRLQMNGRILPEKVSRIEQLHGADIDTGIWQMALDARPENRKRIRLHLPSFRRHSTSELSNSCANKSFPAFSLTGSKCALMCDHCQGKILGPMTPTTTPLDLFEAAKKAAEQKAEGILLSGGSDINGSVLFQPFIKTISEIRKKYGLSIAVHTGLIDKKTADSLSSAGVETAMIDIIGSNKTIRNVYKLNKSVEDYEESLKVLCGTSMKIVPHIVFGLHYGKIRGEYNAMEIISRHKTTAIVVVAVVPYYAKNPAMFPPPTSDDLGSFIAKCRKKLPDRELILGCARPGGVHRQQTDLYALAAGIDSIAFPADGTLAAAKELGYKTEVAYSCCSMAALPKETMQENGETP